MKRLFGMAAALLLCVVLASPASARVSNDRTVGMHARLVTMNFRLRLETQPAAGTTFWIAYGPLAGRFGLIRLHQTGQNLYTAHANLPAAGRANFAYIAGNGTVRTRLGLEPGIPTVTIRNFDRITPGQTQLPVVTWQPPIG